MPANENVQENADKQKIDDIGFDVEFYNINKKTPYLKSLYEGFLRKAYSLNSGVNIDETMKAITADKRKPKDAQEKIAEKIYNELNSDSTSIPDSVKVLNGIVFANSIHATGGTHFSNTAFKILFESMKELKNDSSGLNLALNKIGDCIGNDPTPDKTASKQTLSTEGKRWFGFFFDALEGAYLTVLDDKTDPQKNKIKNSSKLLQAFSDVYDVLLGYHNGIVDEGKERTQSKNFTHAKKLQENLISAESRLFSNPEINEDNYAKHMTDTVRVHAERNLIADFTKATKYNSSTPVILSDEQIKKLEEPYKEYLSNDNTFIKKYDISNNPDASTSIQYADNLADFLNIEMPNLESASRLFTKDSKKCLESMWQFGHKGTVANFIKLEKTVVPAKDGQGEDSIDIQFKCKSDSLKKYAKHYLLINNVMNKVSIYDDIDESKVSKDVMAALDTGVKKDLKAVKTYFEKNVGKLSQNDRLLLGAAVKYEDNRIIKLRANETYNNKTNEEKLDFLSDKINFKTFANKLNNVRNSLKKTNSRFFSNSDKFNKMLDAMDDAINVFSGKNASNGDRPNEKTYATAIENLGKTIRDYRKYKLCDTRKYSDVAQKRLDLTKDILDTVFDYKDSLSKYCEVACATANVDIKNVNKDRLTCWSMINQDEACKSDSIKNIFKGDNLDNFIKDVRKNNFNAIDMIKNKDKAGNEAAVSKNGNVTTIRIIH